MNLKTELTLAHCSLNRLFNNQGSASRIGLGDLLITLNDSIPTDVLSAQLTGYVSASGIITPSDTILSAIEKLNGNDIAGNPPGGITASIQTNSGSGGFGGDVNFTYDGTQLNLNVTGTQSGFGLASLYINTTGSESGIVLNNTGTGGYGWNIVSTNNNSGIGGGNFAILNVQTQQAVMVIQGAGDMLLYPPSGNIAIDGNNLTEAGYVQAGDVYTAILSNPAGDITIMPDSGNINLDNSSLRQVWSIYSSENTYTINNDGSGMMGGGGLNWSNAGTLALNNGIDIRFNGSSDANWKIGRNLSNLVAPYLSPNINSNTLEFVCGNGVGEGFVFGNNSGTHYLEIDSSATAWFNNNIYLDGTLIDYSQLTTINTSGRSLVANDGATTNLNWGTPGTLIVSANIDPPGDVVGNIGENGLRWGNLYIVNVNTNAIVTSDGVTPLVYTIGGEWQFQVTPDANSHNIINVTDPVNSQDAATKNYVDTHSFPWIQQTLTLAPSDLSGLNTYPGYTLIDGTSLTSNQAIIVQSIEFYLNFNTTPYTTTANLFLNYSGNYSGGQIFPAGNTPNNSNFGLLTSSRSFYRFIENSANDYNIPTGSGASLLLMSDGTISGGDSNLLVRVTYQIVNIP